MFRRTPWIVFTLISITLFIIGCSGDGGGGDLFVNSDELRIVQITYTDGSKETFEDTSYVYLNDGYLRFDLKPSGNQLAISMHNIRKAEEMKVVR